MRKKVSVVGAGNVGATLAQMLAQTGLADIVLFDVVKDMPQGKALDIAETCPLWGVSVFVMGTNEYADLKDSDVIIITAGVARKPGMSRDDLLATNASITKEVSREIAKHSPDAIVVTVTNPMDVMAQVVYRETGFDSRRVIGMGGILDASRLRAFVAMELGVSTQDVEALVLGGHGDQMVPLPRYTTVRGIPLAELMDSRQIEKVMERTRNGGAEIVALLKSGSAFYAPAASTLQMVKAMLLDEKRVAPCAVLLNGEYGVKGTYGGVPVVLGARGVERIIELELEKDERHALRDSIKSVEKLFAKIY